MIKGRDSVMLGTMVLKVSVGSAGVLVAYRIGLLLGTEIRMVVGS